MPKTKTFTPADILATPLNTKAILVASCSDQLEKDNRDIIPVQKLPERLLLEYRVESYGAKYNAVERSSYGTFFKTSYINHLLNYTLTPTQVYVLTVLMQRTLPFNWVVIHSSDSNSMSISVDTYVETIARFKKLGLLTKMPAISKKQQQLLSKLYSIKTKKPWIPRSTFYRMSINLFWNGAVKYLYDYPEDIDIRNRSSEKAADI